MRAQRLGVSEARRLLPQLVERIAESGGRVDITRRGRAAVSIVRTTDLEKRARRDSTAREEDYPPAALRGELLVEEDALDDAIRKVRSDMWSVSGELDQLAGRARPPAAAPAPRNASKRPRARGAT